MKTKCPHCDDGCDNCDDGFYETKLGDGIVFSEDCTNDECGFTSGIWVVRKGSPLPTGERRCLMCKWKSEWQLFGWSAPDPEVEDETE